MKIKLIMLKKIHKIVIIVEIMSKLKNYLIEKI